MVKDRLLVLAVVFLAVVGVASAASSSFAQDFSDPADAAAWTVDRQDVEVWNTSFFDGDDRLHIDIDETGPTSGFYAYQGRKLLDNGSYWDAERTAAVSYRFYIDPSWESDNESQQTGVWVVPGTEGVIDAYSVMEYQDSDAAGGEAQLRLFKQTGEWMNVSLPGSVKPERGGWVDVRAVLVESNKGPNGGSELWWYVNNARVAVDDSITTFGDSLDVLELIINSRNFGADQVYYYDDVALEERESMGRGKKAN